MWVCDFFGQFNENLFLFNNCLIKVQIYQSFYTNVKLMIVINHHSQCTIYHFFWINFQLNTDCHATFFVFYIKSPSFTQRLVFQENSVERAKTGAKTNERMNERTNEQTNKQNKKQNKETKTKKQKTKQHLLFFAKL